MTGKTTLRLIYIHGFQGDHTSFQSFPTDLHERLRTRLPSGFVLESCLYPTYKSRRPISEAAENFVSWLSTQPPGPVILLAHSLGGLLAAEVATGSSSQSARVVGLVAFDVPFLGMHPHVIISGIASLLPKSKGASVRSESELNDGNVIKRVHLDDVENAAAGGNSLSDSSPLDNSSHSSRAQLTHSSSSLSTTQIDGDWEAMKSTLKSPISRSQDDLSTHSPTPSPQSPAKSFVSSFASTSSSYISSRIPPLSSSLTVKLERATNRLVQHADSPFLRWLRKHADDPLNAMSKWIIEHFEFGVCMFDPPGLRERYMALERWKGNWVNFWTEVPSRGIDKESDADQENPDDSGGEANTFSGALPNNTADFALIANAGEKASDHASAKQRKAAGKALRKERAKEQDQSKGKASTARPARHFIVLPHRRDACSDTFRFGSREQWERVPICAVDDEVGAHCGLFIRMQNPEYEKLVERVRSAICYTTFGTKFAIEFMEVVRGLADENEVIKDLMANRYRTMYDVA
ncbi:uncharacterized protein FOMMEDRAFT_151266 [Fomitiporia mediterranea MF3/22]|uniref:uncharacterized protein n=1 Tax=Fomitiporia mediterranea (strain MF3/22) TaxID=694068 RepID=UPI00044093BD|nr:uncharacterized protein FOMMEDRAFT_151266 [Fomitiporia mediterranea MF3/22]EJD08409.1 hypothetical protein FOMMEDRAFT_151266 [Fomitiporia mediterranea MF3/22]